MNYWSPCDPSPAASVGSGQYVYADGGSIDNGGLIFFLQRQVTNIVVFSNSSVPLDPKYNPHHNAYKDSLFTDDIAAYFGVQETYTTFDFLSEFENTSAYHYGENKVFDSRYFGDVVRKLQLAQSAGGGIVASFDLVTVENLKWGIPAGFKVNVTFSLLGRLQQWENQLTDENLRNEIVPSNNDDPYVKRDVLEAIGHPLNMFPNYPTAFGGLTVESANLLANLAGWSVKNNEDLLRTALMA